MSHSGVSPLKDLSTNSTSSENKVKTRILNRQFEYVFSELSPLRFGQICIENLQHCFDQNVPDQFKCSFPTMPEIAIDLNGIVKPLSNLISDKTAGPDEIKPSVL